jgi:hypothetical protein
MFEPDLDLQVAVRCSRFRVYDRTGVDSGDGTKWDGVSGLDSSTLSKATIRVVKPAGTFSNVDVLSQIPSPVTVSEFIFNDITGSYPDGLYNLYYLLETVEYSISSFSDYGATVSNTTLVNSTGHGMITGNWTTITGTTNYDGWSYITKVDNNNFYIGTTYVSNDGASTGTVGYQSIFYPYVYCRAEAGVTTMYANISRMTPGPARDQYLDDANTARGLLKSLKSAITSSNATALDNILAEINQLLEFREIEVNF